MIDFPVYEKRLLEVISDYRDGLSEYELLEILKDKENNKNSEKNEIKNNFQDHLTLFKTHFLLFHHLYLLQQKLIQNQEACLEIDPLKIHIKPYTETGQDTLSIMDSLRDYYLDISNLENTTEEDIESLLASFWGKYLANNHRHNALEALGLKDPVDYETIRKRYKQLAMDHHPDRGGNKKKLQEINEAMKQLK